jgi:hypothetical protein
LKGLENPQLYGGRIEDAEINFYRYYIKPNAGITSGQSISTFNNLLTDLIHSYKQEIQCGIKFEDTFEENKKKYFSWLKVLHQSKFCLILATMYII